MLNNNYLLDSNESVIESTLELTPEESLFSEGNPPKEKKTREKKSKGKKNKEEKVISEEKLIISQKQTVKRTKLTGIEVRLIPQGSSYEVNFVLSYSSKKKQPFFLKKNWRTVDHALALALYEALIMIDESKRSLLSCSFGINYDTVSNNKLNVALGTICEINAATPFSVFYSYWESYRSELYRNLSGLDKITSLDIHFQEEKRPNSLKEQHKFSSKIIYASLKKKVV